MANRSVPLIAEIIINITGDSALHVSEFTGCSHKGNAEIHALDQIWWSQSKYLLCCSTFVLSKIEEQETQNIANNKVVKMPEITLVTFHLGNEFYFTKYIH